MSVSAAELKSKYKAAKQAHLAAPGDASLQSAYKAAKKAYKAASDGAAATHAAGRGVKRKAPSSSPAAAAGLPAAAGVTVSVKRSKNTCCRCFVGNLSFKITEEKLRDFFTKAGAGAVDDVFWVTDKATQKFYGSAFVTFVSPDGAEAAVAASGQRCMGRPIRVEMCPAKVTGPSTLKARKKQAPVRTELSKKPEGCRTVYVGNLNYHVDDNKVREFFGGDEIVKFRWLTHKDSGNFKGSGYLEFAEEAGVDNAVLKNGTIFMGRPIRIDYAETRAR